MLRGVALAGISFAGLVALNGALGWYFFSSGLVLASLVALASGWGYARLVATFNPNQAATQRLLQLSIGLSLVLSMVGGSQVFSYVGKADLDPSLDPEALQAAGFALFALQAVGMGLVYRHLRPRSRLPEFATDEGP